MLTVLYKQLLIVWRQLTVVAQHMLDRMLICLTHIPVWVEKINFIWENANILFAAQLDNKFTHSMSGLL